MVNSDDYRERLERYTREREHAVLAPLGSGTQGSVFLIANLSRTRRTAVKFHRRQIAYFRERDVFLRLRDLEIDEVHGHAVPILIGYDDELLAIEMTTVSPPFVLDFGGAYLDQPPEYSDEVWEDWNRMKSEAFEENWPAVEEILGEFQSFGIYIADVNTSNIRF